MRLPVVIASALLLLPLAACGQDEAEPAASPTPSPTASATTTTPAPTADVPQSSAELELAPGRIGPVEVGTIQSDAAATGLFDVDSAGSDGEGCGFDLAWKKQFTGVDVLTDGDGTIVSLGATATDGPRTADDLGVGSTVGELIETYGGDLSAPEEAGYGQIGVFVQDGDAWLGFLIGDATTIEQFDNDPGLEVTLAEATRGEKPGLMRDGC